MNNIMVIFQISPGITHMRTLSTREPGSFTTGLGPAQPLYFWHLEFFLYFSLSCNCDKEKVKIKQSKLLWGPRCVKMPAGFVKSTTIMHHLSRS